MERMYSNRLYTTLYNVFFVVPGQGADYVFE